MYITGGCLARDKVDYWGTEANTRRLSLLWSWSAHCVCGCVSLDSWNERLLGARLLARQKVFVPSSMPSENFNGHSMTGELLRVMVCPPGNAGWNLSGKASAWRELGFRHAPDFPAAQTQHAVLCRLLSECGAEVVCLPPKESLTLNAVYVHDASLATDY